MMATIFCRQCVKACHSAAIGVRTVATPAVSSQKLSGKVAVVTAATDG